MTTLRSFGNSGKELRVLEGGAEAELFRHEGRGCLTHMWFGGDWPGWHQTRIRVYADGVTHLDPGKAAFSGYRFHEAGPIVFQTGFRLAWRNGEAWPGGKPFHNPKPSTATAYTWLYEWPRR